MTNSKRTKALVLNPFLIFRNSFNLKIFWALSSVLIISLLFFCLFQINEIAKGNYLTKNYQKKIADLSGENKGLEITASQLNSLTNIEALVANLNFEKITKIHYIKVLESSVAAK
ncbi:hypothetical protein ACFL0A_00725 [Patescibacteria group bacterium]